MDVNVLKFGGTSMNDARTWQKVLNIIRNYENPVVVVSATARTTRQLIEAGNLAANGNLDQANEIAESVYDRHYDIVDQFLKDNPHPKKQLILESCDKKLDEKSTRLKKLLSYVAKNEEMDPAMQDAIAAIGEQISSYLIAQCGLAMDILTQHVDAKRLIKTDDQYGSANPNRMLINQKCASLETIMDSGFTPVIGGFYGEAPNGTTTTLGFEGSDYSASLIGGALYAKTIEIWTDVSGVYTCDPRYIEHASPIPELSYYDATEMAFFGAKVLHPSTLKPAQERNIPVLVKNIFDSEAPGTRIVRDSGSEKDVLAMSFKNEMALITVSAYETVMGYSFLTKVFEALEELHLPVDAVNTTEASVTLALENSEKLQKLSKTLLAYGSVEVEETKGLISLIGCRISTLDKLYEKVFRSLNGIQVDMITFTKDKRILSFVVADEELISTAQQVHDHLFTESDSR